MEPCLQEQRVHWIQIELVGEDDCPIPGEAFRIALPDGRVVTGSLDDEGKARVENIINAVYCQISFPNLDKDAWEPLAG